MLIVTIIPSTPLDSGASLELAKNAAYYYNKNMNNFLQKYHPFFIIPALAFVFTVCGTTGERIPQDLSPAELIQRAQEASDHNRYKTALQYYQALLDRYSHNIDMVCTSEYSIAFIQYKQKKYSLARGGLNTLLERYNNPDAEILPQQFKRLALIVLNSIDEKEKPLFSKSGKNKP